MNSDNTSMRFLVKGLPAMAALVGSLALSGPALAAADFDLLVGESILNSLNSEPSYAWSIDYHHRPTRHFQWSVTYLNEGHPGPLRRDGLAGEVWVYRTFFRTARLQLALGAGPYAFADTRALDEGGHEDRHGVGGLVSFSTTVRFSERWLGRGTWHRVISHDDLDTDVIMIGIAFALRSAPKPTPPPAPAGDIPPGG